MTDDVSTSAVNLREKSEATEPEQQTTYISQSNQVGHIQYTEQPTQTNPVRSFTEIMSENRANQLRKGIEFSTVGNLKIILEGLPDSASLLGQFCDERENYYPTGILFLGKVSGNNDIFTVQIRLVRDCR